MAIISKYSMNITDILMIELQKCIGKYQSCNKR